MFKYLENDVFFTNLIEITIKPGIDVLKVVEKLNPYLNALKVKI
jgi:hypothetical protein